MSNRELREKRAKLIADAQVILKNETRTAEDVNKANKMLDDADVINPTPGAIDNPEARA